MRATAAARLDVLTGSHAGLDLLRGDPDAIAVVTDDETISFADLRRRVERKALLLGDLPPDWPSMPVRDLAAGLPQAPAEHGAPGRTARLETSLALRAAAIVLIAATHANLLGVQGGAHLLLPLLGLSLARFQLAGATASSRARSLAAIAALPAFDRIARRRPFTVAASAFALTAALRLVLTGVEAGPVERYSLPTAAWLIALGWMIARATTTRTRAISSVLIVASVAGCGLRRDAEQRRPPPASREGSR